MNISPEKKTIENLLGSGRKFLIPRFQREYSWDKRNYQEFFDDMLRGLSYKDGAISSSQYFVGTMLFIGNFTDGSNENIVVVDGQQRMTTITILFSVIAEYFKKYGKETLSKEIFKYIMTTDINGEEVRILVTKTSYPFFSYYIQDYDKNNVQPAISEEELNIKATYEYFIERLEEQHLKNNIAEIFSITNKQAAKIDYLSILKAIRDQVLKSVFVSISTSDKADANKIFEILNAKGKRLESIDLIKNKIFEVEDRTEPVDNASETWKRIKKNIERADEPIGMGTYFRHYWQSKYKNVTMTRLYDDFSKTIKKTQYKEFLKDLEKNSIYYMQITSPSRDDYNNRKEYYCLVQSLQAFNDFGIVQVRVFLLSLFDVKARALIKSALFKDTIIYLENFHFAYNAIAVGKANNKVNRAYIKYAEQLRKADNAETAKAVIGSLISELDLLFPEESAFEEQFIKLQYSKKDLASNLKTRYVLNKIDSHFQNNPIYSTDGSVEHILPESSGTISLNIGNLIILEGTINNELGDEPYDIKRERYKESKHEWVRLFAEQNERWNEEAIENRARFLAKLYYTDILRKK